MKRLGIASASVLALAILLSPAVQGQSDISVSAAGEGTFPPGASYVGVSLSSLTVGMGLTVAGGVAEGQFQATLAGVSTLGLEQEIQIEGQAVSGNSSGNTAIVSGLCTVEVTGAPPVPNVPFTVAIVASVDGTGSITLTVGATNLPAAAITEGSMRIK